MIKACTDSAGPTTLALVVAAHQTGGRIVRSLDELQSSLEALRPEAVNLVELVAGDADFVVVDCEAEEYERM
ncbi:hypothetical protein Cni_G00166 [Canna indica]|uniref:Uncharacterized protein n=1 Tax=Canna indica TaxID=4628 RepID=A0AAQ3JLZ8_9LILI|nr:hypothetical protein Cni_G00166 [Canna indica]